MNLRFSSLIDLSMEAGILEVKIPRFSPFSSRSDSWLRLSLNKFQNENLETESDRTWPCCCCLLLAQRYEMALSDAAPVSII